jgi:hypothetical protein
VAIVEADHLASLPALITPPSDPVRLGAANRALERAGVPWRFGAAVHGEATIEGLVDPRSASDSTAAGPPVTASVRYPLQPQTEAVADTLALAGAMPWVVAGPGYVILATPMDPVMTTWPVRAAFVPWVGDLLGQRLSTGTVAVGARASGVIDAAPGARIRRPVGADALEMPDGAVQILNEQTLTAPPTPGVYFLRHAGVRIGAIVVNPEPSESDLARLSTRELAKRFHGRRVDSFSDADRWAADVFDSQAERPLTAFFIAVALVSVLVETLLTRRVAARVAGAVGSVRRAA